MSEFEPQKPYSESFLRHKPRIPGGNGHHELAEYYERIRNLTREIEIAEFSGRITEEMKKEKINNLHERGLCYGYVGNLDMAIEDFTKALVINPDNELILLARGYTHYERGMLYEQNNQFERAIEEFSKAISDFDKTINIDPNFLDAYFYRGIAHFEKGKFKYHKPPIPFVKIGEEELNIALSDLSFVIENRPNYPDAYYFRGLVYFFLDKLDEAISDLRNAIESDKKDIDAYYFCGLSYYFKEEYENAIRYFTKAINLNPNIPDFYEYRSDAYKKIGNETEAKKDFEKAKDLKNQLGKKKDK